MSNKPPTRNIPPNRGPQAKNPPGKRRQPKGLLASLKSLHPALQMLLIFGICGILALFAVYSIITPKEHQYTTQMGELASGVRGGVVGGEGTPQYNQMIDALNDQAAAEAMAAGGSHVPIPIGDFTEIQVVKPEAPPPPPVQIATHSVPNAQVGSPYMAAVMGNAGTMPYRWSAEGLPPGLSINNTNGQITGTPSRSGGFTFIITLLDGAEQTQVRNFSMEVRPAPAAPPPPPPPPPAPVMQYEPNRALEADLRNIMARTRPVIGSPFYHVVPANQGARDQRGGAGGGTTPPPPGGEAGASAAILAEALQNLSIGKVLYAVTDTVLNSDAPTPVVATVVMAPFEGCKLTGEFQRNDEAMVVAFNRLVLADGKTSIGIRGLAINPETSESDVATDVDTHFLSRWGGLLASSFIQGFGQAMVNKNQPRTTESPSGTIISEPQELTYRDVSLEALAVVGQRTADIFGQQFNRPPTVTLRAGQPIGVLILDFQGQR